LFFFGELLNLSLILGLNIRKIKPALIGAERVFGVGYTSDSSFLTIINPLLLLIIYYLAIKEDSLGWPFLTLIIWFGRKHEVISCVITLG